MDGQEAKLSLSKAATVAALASAALVLNGGAALALPPLQGVPAPAFALQTLSGAPWSLESLRGHVVLVNFFATWCPPCRAETPDLVAIERVYARKGVVFIGVDDRESPALVSAFVKAKGIHFTVVMDDRGSVEESYDVRAIPTTYVLDQSGTIRYRQVDQLNAPVLSSVLDAVIAGKPLPESVASQRFHQTAHDATVAVGAAVDAAKASSDPKTSDLTTAVDAGVAANKKLDAMQNQSDSASINYFDMTSTRDALDTVLADAYVLRASQPNSNTAVADETEAALLRGQVLTDQERFADSLAQFQMAMKLAPKDTRGYDGAYLAAYEMKDYAQAAQIAAAEAQLVPDDPESWLAVASSQNTLKNYPKALDAERTALGLASAAYTKDPTSKHAAYEFGRVWLKMARTQLLAGNAKAAQPLLLQAQAAAPGTIVAQQANEQYIALEPSAIAIEGTASIAVHGADAAPAELFVLVRNPSAQSRTVNLKASGLPPKWLLSFCFSTVCNPYKVSFELPAGGSKRIELLVAPLSQTKGPWTMSVSASGTSTAMVHLAAKTAQAAITITGS